MNKDAFFGYLKGLTIILASWFSFSSVTSWVACAITITVLVIVSLYQKREALKTLMCIKDRKTELGIVLFTLSLLIYISSAYFMEGALSIFASASPLLLLASLLVLTLNYRIPRELFVIFASISLIFPPLRNYEDWPILTRTFFTFIAGLFSGLLVFDIIRSLGKDENCPVCELEPEDIDFCPYCGREIYVKVRQERNRKSVFVVIIVLFIVVGINFVSIPTLYLSHQNGFFMEFYTLHGRRFETPIRLSNDYVLLSSDRLCEYETQTSEDLALQNTYRKGENDLSILLEIGEHEPYFRNSWKLPDWDYQRFLEDIQITETTLAKSYILRKDENTLVVLKITTLTLLLKGESSFLPKKVGVSLFINFSHPIDDVEIFSKLNLLKTTSTFVVRHLFAAETWTNKLHVLSQISAYFKDYLFAVLSVLSFFLLAWWSRFNDDKRDEIVDKAFATSPSEMKLLIAAVQLKKRKFTGRQLFRSLTSIEDRQAVADFVATAKLLEEKELLRRDFVIRRSRLVMVWASVL